MTHQTILHLADGTKVVVDGGSLETKPNDVVIAHKGSTVKGAKGAIVIALAGSNVTDIDETYLVAVTGATVDGDLLDDLAFNPVELERATPEFDPHAVAAINAWVEEHTGKSKILEIVESLPVVAPNPAAIVVLYDGETFIAAFAGRTEVSQGRVGIALRGGSIKALSGATVIVLPHGCAETQDGATLIALPGAYVNGARVDSFTISTPE